MNTTSKWLLAAAISVTSMSAHAVAYTVTNLGAIAPLFPGHFDLDLNESGQVASSLAGAGGVSQAALWSKGAWQVLSPDGQSAGLGLNDLGHVVGFTTVNGKEVATLWKDGAAQLLPGFPNEPSSASDINNAGHIVGDSSRDQFFGGPMHAQWKDGTISYLNGPLTNWGFASAINEAGQIVGGSRIYRGTSPVRWDNGVVSWLGDPDLGGRANGINNHGAVAGEGYDLNRGATSAAIWSADGITYVDARLSYFKDINDAGIAVGAALFDDPTYSREAMLYQDGQVHALTDLIVGDRSGLGLLISAEAINNNGQIVAYGSLDGQFPGDGKHAFLLTPVPEPEHVAMLLLGLGMIGFAARRKAG